MKQSTIWLVTFQIFTDFKNSFTSELDDKIVAKQHITP